LSELRWNPLTGEWVATATHRQERTFLPPPDFCPLCPTRPGGFPTEVPEPTYDIVVFENLFPTFRRSPPEPAVEGTPLTPVRPSRGVCEVILYTPDHHATLAGESAGKIEHLVQVWTDRFRELGDLDFVDYVFIFENKGVEIGVTIHHPHGQIYAYPFVPPVIEGELLQCRKHYEATGRCLLCDILNGERRDGRRVVLENRSFMAYIPFFARWPYEVHLSPTRHLQAVTDLTKSERMDFALALKSLLSAYDRLFDRSFPYVMAMHNRPTDGGSYPHYHLHVEFYPPLRTAAKLKYLAGSEIGAGLFINDTLPEEKAAELRAHVAAAAN
jgi:UDPglucose--hexose-1-phosphate uridylyltransferase